MSHRSASTPAPRKQVILTVNDSPAALYLTNKILSKAGFEVIEAKDGATALAMARQALPEVILLDIRLPDIDGLEIARRLRADEATRSIPIIHTSATFVTSDKKAEGLDAGGDAYLTQPFESIELVALVRALLRMRAFENEARERADALLVADRRKNEFLAMLAHELRNPLSAIGAAISLLQEEEGANGRSKKIRDTLERQAHHLGRLVDDLLDVSRITHGKVLLKRGQVDLRDVATSAVEALKASFDRSGVRLVLEAGDAPLPIDGDRTRLEQVVLNLLDNALKYTPRGGRVAVSVLQQDGRDTASLIVADTGAGIEPGHLEDLFQLFYQGDTSLARSQGGLGIGLTMVRRLVELHGGTIRVVSDGLGEGTRFTVELPVVPEHARREIHARAPVKAPQRRRVLLVDDNADSCELFQLALEKVGHDVEAVHDGEAGLSRLAAGGFDVAVIDIGLPLMDGYTVAQQAREVLGEEAPPLIAMTGYGQRQDREAARSAGFVRHLLKPVRPQALIDEIEHLTSSAVIPPGDDESEGMAQVS